ncbi:MAG: glycoside hydrolase family 5 protein [Vallitalea sp.]|nr:glycoside hydrolase family 5 protein [Vallitalea sp.]
MEKRKYRLVMILLLFITISCFMLIKYCNQNKATLPFHKCMNIGNALDSPKNIKWDVELKNEYFDLIKNAGFDSVRIPVRFSDYAKDQPNYKLEENFMKEVDEYIDYAISKDLVVILDLHHFSELMKEPDKYKNCFLRIWEQLSQRYQNHSDKLVFEILNEPNKNLKYYIWNKYLNEAIRIVRKTNKYRLIIIGSTGFSSLDNLKYLKLPKDKNLIATFHFYEPNEFTFQGNVYHEGFEHLKNIPWSGTDSQSKYIKERFSKVKKWADENRIIVFLGEFGVNKNAPQKDRVVWVENVRKTAEEMGFAWGYWEFCSEFGVYDTKRSCWNEFLLDALIEKR